MDLSLAVCRKMLKTKSLAVIIDIPRLHIAAGYVVNCEVRTYKSEKLNFFINLPERSRDLVYHFGTSLAHFGLVAKLWQKADTVEHSTLEYYSTTIWILTMTRRKAVVKSPWISHVISMSNGGLGLCWGFYGWSSGLFITNFGTPPEAAQDVQEVKARGYCDVAQEDQCLESLFYV